MITHLRRAWKRATASADDSSVRLDCPVLLLQSDDWGRVGVRDREGYEELRGSGIQLGEGPYDFYSMETADDLQALSEVLKKHHDSVGRNPAIVMNFVLANVDFDRSLDSSTDAISLLPLTSGLPAGWRRPRLFDAYRQGIEQGVFFPALHGLTHFCSRAITRELQEGGERALLLLKMWRAQTPYIYRRMPWIGYEYWDPAQQPENRFLALQDQRVSISKAAEIFKTFFSSAAFSACAPGYRANADTLTAWSEAGVRVVQHGPGQNKAPHLDRQGMLHTFRNVEIEPAIAATDVESLVQSAEECFRSGIPVVASMHSINFHSTIRDFRTSSLAVLDEFLGKIEQRWPNLLYAHDADLFRIVTEGVYSAKGTEVEVGVTTMKAAK